ncbi:MAG: hypothetical protein A3I32_02575 [Candidatus Yanofskybacteria bacterium RIFCSPLOWO2_02_FULL_45_10]|uniref:DUF115 domain-containing protein n=3 Tax=Patescibacteria group TaxID=1783273 RepID=A0A1F8G2I2_9BACT|nr:MAG: hypothetical protein UU67_C0001G0010 [Candidatus Daviesbacteria bacterium GW2011_GWB1_41_5]OGN19544.1 MAG: hypothetical protein A3F25_00370 [Candidatus Yanofskybacteria bacterium RIFCSPHIGHO2_12_FULL_45_19b]OGN32259.1 MAG: hypothetical protein A3I32_02575 [Candidatus Yanofskybacteria bacterium RIFCSPLOWO2_02_FULL_45_10]
MENNLGKQIAQFVSKLTADKVTAVGLRNAKLNRPHYRKTIDDLLIPKHGPDSAAIVVVGGPSLHRKHTAARIAQTNFTGDIITADGSFGYCLRHGVIPQYMVCLDPNPYRIVRWFGDPDLASRPPDDYFRRQDFDPKYWEDEMRYNQELTELVNQHGSKIKAILCTSVDPTVTKRCVESGMDIYWWNQFYDDPDDPTQTVTRELVGLTGGIPCMNTGGNVGTAAYIFSWAVLGHRQVALAGFDLGYAPGTPFLNTQYFYELRDLFGERVAEAYIEIQNPYLNETWYTDPTYYWFREIILELAKQAPCTTYNCTEGGTLFGANINFISLSEFLNKFGQNGG